MTPDQYRDTLTGMGLSIQGRLTSRLLGITPRMSAYYAAGTYAVPDTVANLIWLLKRARWAGVTPRDVDAYLSIKRDRAARAAA